MEDMEEHPELRKIPRHRWRLRAQQVSEGYVTLHPRLCLPPREAAVVREMARHCQGNGRSGPIAHALTILIGFGIDHVLERMGEPDPMLTEREATTMALPIVDEPPTPATSVDGPRRANPRPKRQRRDAREGIRACMSRTFYPDPTPFF